MMESLELGEKVTQKMFVNTTAKTTTTTTTKAIRSLRRNRPLSPLYHSIGNCGASVASPVRHSRGRIPASIHIFLQLFRLCALFRVRRVWSSFSFISLFLSLSLTLLFFLISPLNVGLCVIGVSCSVLLLCASTL